MLDEKETEMLLDTNISVRGRSVLNVNFVIVIHGIGGNASVILVILIIWRQKDRIVYLL